MVAGQSGLVEDGAVAADEAPVGRLDNLSSVILQWKADVEDLAGVVDIGVVTVGLVGTDNRRLAAARIGLAVQGDTYLTVALEVGLEWGLEQGLCICGEGVGQGVGWRLGCRGDQGQSGESGNGDGEDQGLVAHHGEGLELGSGESGMKGLRIGYLVQGWVGKWRKSKKEFGTN